MDDDIEYKSSLFKKAFEERAKTNDKIKSQISSVFTSKHGYYKQMKDQVNLYLHEFDKVRTESESHVYPYLSKLIDFIHISKDQW